MGTDGTDERDVDSGTPTEVLVDRLHAELRATEELPVERAASRWIGEAQAVAGDAANADLDEPVVRERVARVRELLDHVETTGHDAADERVERALDLASVVCEGT